MEDDLKHMEDVQHVEFHGEKLPNGDKFQPDRKFLFLFIIKF